ncbi:MAG TPA: hypothetical protein VN605_12410, partial [Thermoanaerobaculia bacterium]|nr:hypothetical protein [Thermoanaerobaculia bacterium]
MATSPPSWPRLVLITASALFCAAGASALPYAAFGPKNYTRATGAPAQVRSTFTARAGSYTLRVENGATPVTSATVTLNGTAVLSP